MFPEGMDVWRVAATCESKVYPFAATWILATGNQASQHALCQTNIEI